MNVFDRYAPFIQDFIYRSGWQALRGVHNAAGEAIFGTEDNVLLTASTDVSYTHLLNIMHLSTPYSAILSALIFNAMIIPCLIPLAMKGVKYRPMSSGKLLARNMLIYGLGGVITPFVGIKIIDMLIAPLLSAIGMIGL